MKHTDKKKHILYFLTGVIATICLFVPAVLMNKQADNTLNSANSAPSDSYMASSVVMARYISNQLSDYERVQLIAGGWDAVYLPAEWNEIDMNTSAATDRIKRNLNKIHKQGAYELSFDSTYENWYSWETSLYKAVDANFGTYLAYYTVTKFTKYDGSFVYYVIASENGDILYAYTDYTNFLEYDTVFDRYHKDYAQINREKPEKTDIVNFQKLVSDSNVYLYIPAEE